MPVSFSFSQSVGRSADMMVAIERTTPVQIRYYLQEKSLHSEPRKYHMMEHIKPRDWKDVAGGWEHSGF